jgi:hypothetical protein
MAEIADNPFPNPRSPNLTEDWSLDGRKILQYSDSVFPYLITFLRLEPPELDYGVILVIDLKRLRGR